MQKIAQFIFDKKAKNSAEKQQQARNNAWVFYYRDFSKPISLSLSNTSPVLTFFQKELDYIRKLNTRFSTYCESLFAQEDANTLKECLDDTDYAYIADIATLYKEYNEARDEREKLYSAIVAHINTLILSHPNKKTVFPYKLQPRTKEQFPTRLEHPEISAVQEAFSFIKSEHATPIRYVHDSFKVAFPTPAPVSQKKSKTGTPRKSKKISAATKDEVIEEPQVSTTLASTAFNIEKHSFYIKIKEPTADFILYNVHRSEIQLNIPKLDYAPRVKAWFSEPQEALQQQGYLNPQNTKYAAEQFHSSIILKHAFPRIIDEYLPRLAFASTWLTPDKKHHRQYCIPGEIQYKNERGEICALECVLFVYTFDEHNVCYHRCASIKAPNDLIKEYMTRGNWQVHYDEDFPALGH